MSKHTPGPWRVFKNDAGTGVTAGQSDVAHCHGFDSRRSADEVDANAYLIAASPKLLAALAPLADTIMTMEKNGMLHPYYQLRLGKEAASQIVDAVRAARGER